MGTDFKRENEIIGKLKELCWNNGREKDVRETANLFHQLALIYATKSSNKTVLIQCAALLNGAIARNPENVEEMINDRAKFCSNLLQISGAKIQHSDLVRISLKIAKDIHTMRNESDALLDLVSIIPRDISNFEQEKIEKIKKIKNIQIQIANMYSKIMKNICDECVRVMGPPPCLFALIGLGSLARNEITPYSDFENIIILQEGVQHKSDYDTTKDYFRWFAVIFQVILINLKETNISRVNIPGLNGEDHKNLPNSFRFYDNFTPLGVSFDGMVPHACKSPLGRQEKTEKKPFILELIQPVSKMASLIEYDEDLKNGYNLADMLTKFCFVSGDKDIFNEYKLLIETKLIELRRDYNEEYINSIFQQINQNKSAFDIIKNLASVTEYDLEINIKRIVYRTSTLFISALGRLHHISAVSCFEILEELQKRSVINHTDQIQLSFAIAVACECRLRNYSHKKSQDDMVENSITKSEVIKFMEIKSITEYFKISMALQNNILDFKGNLEFDERIPVLISYYFREIEYSIQEGQKLLKNADHATAVFCYKIIGFCFQCIHKQEEALDSVQNALEVLNKIPEYKLNKNAYSTLYNQMGDCFYHLNQFQEAFESYENALKSFKSSFNHDLPANILRNMGISKAGIEFYEEAVPFLTRSLDIYKKISKDIERDKAISRVTNSLGIAYYHLKDIDKALDLYTQSLLIREKIYPSPYKVRGNSFACSNIGLCYLDLKQYNNALVYYEKSLKILEQIQPEPMKDFYICVVLNNIGICKYNLGYYSEALEMHKKALRKIEIVFNIPETSKKEYISLFLSNVDKCDMHIYFTKFCEIKS